MRGLLAAALLSAFLGSGCFGAGLNDSSTSCSPLTDVTAGFRFRVSPGSAPAESLVGRCVTIARDDDNVDGPFAASKLNGTLEALLPIEGPGRYYLTVSANLENDSYCQYHAAAFVDHPGTGLVDAYAEAGQICA